MRLQAHTTYRLVISGALTAILTEKSIATVQSAIREYKEQEDTDSSLPAEDISLLREDLSLFLRAAGSAEKTGNFLTTFITRIKLFPDRAVVHYAMPLPADSHLARATEQEVLLSPSPAP